MKWTLLTVCLMGLVSACGSDTPCEDWCESANHCSGGSFEAGGDNCADSCESARDNFHEMGDACGEAFDAYIACGATSSCSMMAGDCNDEDQAFTDTCIAAQ